MFSLSLSMHFNKIVEKKHKIILLDKDDRYSMTTVKPILFVMCVGYPITAVLYTF